MTKVAEQMTHRAVFLDVFGVVRWSTERAPAVEGATRWVGTLPDGTVVTPSNTYRRADAIESLMATQWEG